MSGPLRGVLLSALLAAGAPVAALDVRPTVTSVTDQRWSGQLPSWLDVSLKLIGDDAASVRGIRLILAKAVDDSGRSVLPEVRADGPFDAVEAGSGQPALTLRLNSPARRATVIQEIAGDLQLFVPDRDPSAIVLVGDALKKTGKPLSEPSLARAGVSLTIMTKVEYEALKREKERSAKQGAQQPEGVARAMTHALEGLFGGFFQPGDNDLVFRIEDPKGGLVRIDVVDAKGERIRNQGTFRSSERLMLTYQDPLPADARLRISLRTPRSVVSVPLRLVDVALP